MHITLLKGSLAHAYQVYHPVRLHHPCRLAHNRVLPLHHHYACSRNSAVMDRALAMHDACLRSVLQHHHGYEVSSNVVAHVAMPIAGDLLSWGGHFLLCAMHAHALLARALSSAILATR